MTRHRRPPGWQSMSFDELLAIGLCDCGVWFEEHAPLKRIRQVTWMSQRQSLMPWRNTITGRVMTDAAARFMGVGDQAKRSGIRICQFRDCHGPIGEHRAWNAKFCSNAHMRQEHYLRARDRVPEARRRGPRGALRIAS